MRQFPDEPHTVPSPQCLRCHSPRTPFFKQQETKTTAHQTQPKKNTIHPHQQRRRYIQRTRTEYLFQL